MSANALITDQNAPESGDAPPRRVDGLDSIRFVSALWVVFFMETVRRFLTVWTGRVNLEEWHEVYLTVHSTALLRSSYFL